MTYEDFLAKMPDSLRESHRQMRSAMQATGRFARSGFLTTPPEALAAREATCRACPEWDAEALNATGRCRKCGCSTWAKLRMATERCPLGKWEAVERPETGKLKPEI
jgi:predicted Zn-ribbon and HTH transcriptional regulator